MQTIYILVALKKVDYLYGLNKKKGVKNWFYKLVETS